VTRDGGPLTLDGGPAGGGAVARLEAHLAPLVGTRTVAGLVYAVVTPDGQATGELPGTGGKPLGPHASVETGSVTKVFTALLLADMTERGEARLDDLIAHHLPAEVADGCPAAAQITLRHLATHTSGLPRLPRNLIPMALRHPSDPYARYTTAHLFRALRAARMPATPGYQYSNFGFGLLGYLLSHTAGRSYGELITDRVTGPLGLTETGIGMPDGMTAATGHRAGLRRRSGRPTPPWQLGALAGAGALRSTAADLGRFLAVNLNPAATPLQPAFEVAQRPQPQAPDGPLTGLAWHIATLAGRPVLWHNGGTGGFSAMLALDRAAGYGVAAVATTGPRRDLPLDRAVFTALAELTDGR